MPRKAKTIIHVNQHVIKANRKTGAKNPVLTVKNRGKNTYAHEVVIYGQDGKIAAKVVYSPDKPLSCGAHVWIETTNEVRTAGEKPWHGGPAVPEQLLSADEACRLAGVDFEVVTCPADMKSQS